MGNIGLHAVLILANLMDERGNLNEESRARVSKGVEVFNDQAADYILTSGWAYRCDTGQPIAEAMRHTLVEDYGIDVTKVIPLAEPRDTVGDAFFTRKYIDGEELINRLSVVTSDYHLARTKEIFEFIFSSLIVLDFIPAMVGMTRARQMQESDSLTAFRDTFSNVAPGDIGAIEAAMRERHPFYNGQIYPKI